MFIYFDIYYVVSDLSQWKMIFLPTRAWSRVIKIFTVAGVISHQHAIYQQVQLFWCEGDICRRTSHLEGPTRKLRSMHAWTNHWLCQKTNKEKVWPMKWNLHNHRTKSLIILKETQRKSMWKTRNQVKTIPSISFYLSFNIFIHRLKNIINMSKFFLNFLKYP